MARILPNELTSLIHHVELNEAGWQDKTWDYITLAALMANNKPLSVNELVRYIRKKCNLRTTKDRIKDRIENLQSEKQVQRVGRNKYELTEP